MKQLLHPKKTFWEKVKNDTFIKNVLASLYSMSLGAILATSFKSLQTFISVTVLLSVVVVIFRLIYFKFYHHRYTIIVDGLTLNIRGETFNKEAIEYLSYTQSTPKRDDFLKIKLKGLKERHICIYEEHLREQLRLYHFINDNFIPIKLIEGQ